MRLRSQQAPQGETSLSKSLGPAEKNGDPFSCSSGRPWRAAPTPQGPGFVRRFQILDMDVPP
eukprot:7980420-Alexandrium_andersonii.AAC.1